MAQANQPLSGHVLVEVASQLQSLQASREVHLQSATVKRMKFMVYGHPSHIENPES